MALIHNPIRLGGVHVFIKFLVAHQHGRGVATGQTFHGFDGKTAIRGGLGRMLFWVQPQMLLKLTFGKPKDTWIRDQIRRH